ncbi:MAG: hypothetical protein ACRD0M_08170, partial [Acidimicrobiales bacterium]
DNEWTDCHPTGRDPIERLSHVRRTMFASTRSFGREALDLDQQRPGYPENGRWRVGLVRFISLHVVGSNNNHIADPDVEEVGTPRGAADRRAAEDEYRLRDEANRRWLAEGFALAGRERAPVVVVAIHADPRFGVPPAERAARRADGFDAFLGALVPEVRAFGQPVVLIHGDSHRFVHDQPLLDWATGESVPNLTRIETFGSPDVGWVEVVVDPRQPDRPRVDAHLVGSFPN